MKDNGEGEKKKEKKENQSILSSTLRWPSQALILEDDGPSRLRLSVIIAMVEYIKIMLYIIIILNPWWFDVVVGSSSSRRSRK